MTPGARYRSPQGQGNPLAVLPSILAIHDLRRRANRHLAGKPLAESDLIALLRLDPLAVLRGLRAAMAPLYGCTTSRWSIPDLVQALGTAMTLRLCHVKERGSAGTHDIRRVWMTAVATGCAAEILAEGTDLPPAAAYLLGLLRPTMPLLALVAQMQNGRRATEAELAAHVGSWNLPPELMAAIGIGPAAGLPTTIAALLVDAENTAEIAGYGSVQEQNTAPAPLDTAPPHLLAAATRTRRAVESQLRQVGLDFTLPDSDGPSPSVDGLPLTAPKSSSFEESVLTMLSCSGGTSYRGVITALTAAGVRHGGYDRATYVRLSPTGFLVVRSKADLSSRRVAELRVTPNPAETSHLVRAHMEGRAIRLELEGGETSGLLAMLGADEALVVPVNREMATPSFLILDRSISNDPIRPVVDTDRAMSVGLCGALLIENQLLQKRRQRALKFAKTDGLTRLLNRSAGIHALERELLRASRTGRPVSVLLCDLDNFKDLNDSLGHLQGDQALRLTAEVLRQTTRRTDHVSRYGGEEFLIVLPETSPEDATVIAARIHVAVAERGAAANLPLTASIGLAVARGDEPLEALLRRADHALYASKERGRNRFSADSSDDPSDSLADETSHRTLQ